MLMCYGNYTDDGAVLVRLIIETCSYDIGLISGF